MAATDGTRGRSAPGPSEQASAEAPRFTNLVHLERVDSTNRYALDAARAGAAEGLVVVADAQDAGRGRKGRSWTTPPGGALLCSLLFRPRLPTSDFHLVQSLVALCALAAIETTAGIRASLKWPNDLLVDEEKLGGILTELVTSTAGSPAGLVVGLGINLSFPPGWTVPEIDAALALSPTTLERAGRRSVGRDELLDALLGALEDRYPTLSTAVGRAAVLAEYTERLATLGRAVRVTTAEREWQGVAVGLGADGSLRVETDEGEVLIEAGDVLHLRAP